MLAARQFPEALTRHGYVINVLKFTAFATLLPIGFIGADWLPRVNPVAVRQRLQTTSDCRAEARMVFVGAKVTEGGLVGYKAIRWVSGRFVHGRLLCGQWKCPGLPEKRLLLLWLPGL